MNYGIKLLASVLGAAMLHAAASAAAPPARFTGEQTMPYLRWSELEIDPAGLDTFKVLADENAREARRTEPGVLAFYWAAKRIAQPASACLRLIPASRPTNLIC